MKDVIKTYIVKAALEVQDILHRVGELVLEVDPELTQTLSYQMPTFKKHGKPILYFAAHKNHPGIYPTPPTIAQFVARLAGYKTSKGAI